MVRTKIRARTLEERFPNGPPQIRLPPGGTLTPNNRIFTDHNGKQALMSWESIPSNPSLSPLHCWVFYVTYPHAPSDFDGCAFYNKLEDDEGYGGSHYFRYEFFFLPGATAEECHRHYVAEMEARGTIWDSILKVKTAMKLKEQENDEIEGDIQDTQDYSSNQDTAENGQLPGLVVPEFDEQYLYRNWLFIYADPNPDCSGSEGLTREMYIVEFDPIPQDMEENCAFNPVDHPVYSKRVKARGEDGFVGSTSGCPHF
ncbi:hypothetical protein FAVG1_12172 [Fusarium avenaceum]|nr:hypothetical protein FAVG1_12172 [Fusarium avenaceum]